MTWRGMRFHPHGAISPEFCDFVAPLLRATGFPDFSIVRQEHSPQELQRDGSSRRAWFLAPVACSNNSNRRDELRSRLRRLESLEGVDFFAVASCLRALSTGAEGQPQS